MPVIIIIVIVGGIFSLGFYFGAGRRDKNIAQYYRGHKLTAAHKCGICGGLYDSDPTFAYHLATDHK